MRSGSPLLGGWTAAIRELLPLIPVWGLAAAEIGLGLALGGFALWSARAARAGHAFTPPARLSVAVTALLAVSSTVSDLPTAIPYFAAVNQIVAAGGEWPAEVALLLLYSLLYCSPMIALVVLHLVMPPERSERLFGRATQWINWAFAKLLPPLTGLAGIALLIDGVRRLVSA